MKELRLVRYDISSDIVIPQDKYLTLVIENKEFLYKFISELRGQIEKGDFDVFSFTVVTRVNICPPKTSKKLPHLKMIGATMKDNMKRPPRTNAKRGFTV